MISDVASSDFHFVVSARVSNASCLISWAFRASCRTLLAFSWVVWLCNLSASSIFSLISSNASSSHVCSGERADAFSSSLHFCLYFTTIPVSLSLTDLASFFRGLNWYGSKSRTSLHSISSLLSFHTLIVLQN